MIRWEGLRAEPLACKVVVLNRPCFEHASELGRELRAERVPAEDWSLGIGMGQGPGDSGYDAHVVAVIERRWLLDLTVDQCNRPERGIASPLPDGVLSGDEPAPMLLTGSFVRYTALPEDRRFLTVPDRRLIRPNELAVRRLAH